MIKQASDCILYSFTLIANLKTSRAYSVFLVSRRLKPRSENMTSSHLHLLEMVLIFFQDLIKDINVAAFEFERSSKSYMATCKHDCTGDIKTELTAALAAYKNVKIETV